MSNLWVRLWLDMPTDPKFRVIAKKSGRPLPEVIAVFVFMLTVAGKRTDAERTHANASERGELCGWSDDDAAAALDLEASDIVAIRDAMQGSWTACAWSDGKKTAKTGGWKRGARKGVARTQANASERTRTPRDRDRYKTRLFKEQRHRTLGTASK